VLGQQTTTSRRHGVTIRVTFFALLGVAVLAVLWWQSQTSDTPPARSGDRSHQTVAAPGQSTGSQVGANNDASEAERQQLPANETTANPANEWTVQLIGIKPAVPWTAPLRITFEDRLDVHGTVDGEGVCRFLPPPGARNPGLQHMRLTARDDNYRIVDQHHRSATLQRTGHMTVLVDAMANLRGRVLAPDGAGTVARIRAFTFDANGPREPLLARTESGPDGHYKLQVRPGIPLLIVADATAAGLKSFSEAKQSTFVLADLPLWSLENLNMLDGRRPRADWLPASLTTEAVFRSPRDLPELQLGTGSLVTGRVTFANGQPLANVIVAARLSEATKPAWHNQLHWSQHQQVVPGAFTHTDADGTFSLHLTPGEQFMVQVTSDKPLMLAGEPTAVTTAPGRVALIVPGQLLTIHVVHNGEPVAGASIDIETFTWKSDHEGALQVTLKPEATRIRARHNASISGWTALPTIGRPTSVQLQLEARDLSKVRIDLRSKPTLQNATFVWQPLPEGAPITLSGQRQHGNEPFELLVPAGNYELSIRDSKSGNDGRYSLPNKHTVEVPAAGLVTSYDITFGGTIDVDVLTQNRTRVGGTFSLMASNGQDVTPQTIARDTTGTMRVSMPGTLQSISTNRLATILPAGIYTLTVTTQAHGTVTRSVTVTARSSTHVPITLR
jgi:hypothetical protein